MKGCMKRSSSIWMTGLCLACVFSFSNSWAGESEHLKVLATIRPLALLAQDVAGEAADVDVLLAGDASPHHYSLRISDMQKIEDADLLVWLGPEFERFLAGVIAPGANGRLLTLSELPGLSWPEPTEASPHRGHEHPRRDLHLWLSPANGATILQAVAARLTQLRPELGQTFADNAAAAQARLDAASKAVKDDLAPVAHHGFGVGHDAFSHFANYFNLKQLAAVSALPDQSLSARHLSETARKLKSARCLIVEAGEPASSSARLERLFKIPVVAADPLALNPDIDSYPALITDLGRSFVECLR